MICCGSALPGDLAESLRISGESLAAPPESHEMRLFATILLASALAFQPDGYTAKESIPGRVVAYGDYNGDRYTDLFVVQDKQVHIYLQTLSSSFIKAVSVTLEHPVVNVSPADFNRDGQLDFLVSTLIVTGNPIFPKYSLENILFIGSSALNGIRI